MDGINAQKTKVQIERSSILTILFNDEEIAWIKIHKDGSGVVRTANPSNRDVGFDYGDSLSIHFTGDE